LGHLAAACEGGKSGCNLLDMDMEFGGGEKVTLYSMVHQETGKTTALNFASKKIHEGFHMSDAQIERVRIYISYSLCFKRLYYINFKFAWKI